MHQLITELYPICRSITGDGVRQTLRRLQSYIPLTVHEVPTGTQVFDWTVPKEWNIRDAYVKNPCGEKVIDFQKSSLHVLNYSTPVAAKMPLSELKQHLYTLPKQPTLIPYRTSYYQENWGFCLTHETLQRLEAAEQAETGDYEIKIDSTLADGALTYGEFVLPGESEETVLISCHCCHPALCNDNLSGIALSTMLAQQMSAHPRRYTYRFLFIPGTIGSITWLALHEREARQIRHGLVVACVGDAGAMTYKKSRRGNAEIDRAVQHVLKTGGAPYKLLDFSPYGYDERQYCSPGFNLPVGSLTRTPHGQFPEYHTSADNPEFVQPATLADSLMQYLAVIDVLERNRTYCNLNPMCEPQLGKRGLYSALGGRQETQKNQLAMLWVLNGSDGQQTLLDIAEKADLPFTIIADMAQLLLEHNLLALA
ncbi:MAG: DUF4910 domain-containing protein [Caldilineaceae bacterium]